MKKAEEYFNNNEPHDPSVIIAGQRVSKKRCIQLMEEYATQAKEQEPTLDREKVMEVFDNMRSGLSLRSREEVIKWREEFADAICSLPTEQPKQDLSEEELEDMRDAANYAESRFKQMKQEPQNKTEKLLASINEAEKHDLLNNLTKYFKGCRDGVKAASEPQDEVGEIEADQFIANEYPITYDKLTAEGEGFFIQICNIMDKFKALTPTKPVVTEEAVADIVLELLSQVGRQLWIDGMEDGDGERSLMFTYDDNGIPKTVELDIYGRTHSSIGINTKAILTKLNQ